MLHFDENLNNLFEYFKEGGLFCRSKLLGSFVNYLELWAIIDLDLLIFTHMQPKCGRLTVKLRVQCYRRRCVTSQDNL